MWNFWEKLRGRRKIDESLKVLSDLEDILKVLSDPDLISIKKRQMLCNVILISKIDQKSVKMMQVSKSHFAIVL
jgi:hypothetical protein